jgi:hypothetical protein
VDEIVAASVLVDVGEKDLPGAGDLGLGRNRRCIASSRPTLGGRLRRQSVPERPKTYAMISGVIWSSMKAIRSRSCNLRFFSRCSRSKSGAGD